MSRYFFNIIDGVSVPDPIGTDLPDFNAVGEEAMAVSSEAIRQLGSKFWQSQSVWQMDVTDAVGTLVMRLKCSGKIDLDFE
jgi:hypothetical protein